MKKLDLMKDIIRNLYIKVLYFVDSQSNNTYYQNVVFRGIYLVVIGLVVSFSSCETLVNDVDPKLLPSSNNRLVVHSYLSPQDTVITVAVSYSAAVTGNGLDVTPVLLKDATVTLSNQNRAITIPFNSQNSLYQIAVRQMPILAGQTYKLNVSWGSISPVESSCTIPQPIAIKEVKLDSAISQNSVGSTIAVKDYLFRIVWQDPADEKNYYRVAGYMQRTPTTVNAKTTVMPISFSDRRDDVDFISDYNFQGGQMISGSGKVSMASTNTKDKIVYTLILAHCEKSFYDYHKAVATFDGLNPFTEPSIIPSNIKGGLGCFAGYNKTIFVAKK